MSHDMRHRMHGQHPCRLAECDGPHCVGRPGAAISGSLRHGIAKQTPMHASERASILAELTPPFTLLRPEEQLTPVVFCSPHSGRVYPKAFLEASRLDPHTLRKSEDCFVDELFEPVVGAGCASDRGAFSACLSRRQSRALRARSRAVQRPAAGLCQYPVGPSGGRARHHCPGGGGHRRDLPRAAAHRRRFRAHRAPVPPVSRGAGRPAGGDAQAASAWPC